MLKSLVNEMDRLVRPVLRLRPLIRVPLAIYLGCAVIALQVMPPAYQTIRELILGSLYVLLIVWFVAVYRKKDNDAHGS
jgi:hypothetical protein